MAQAQAACALLNTELLHPDLCGLQDGDAPAQKNFMEGLQAAVRLRQAAGVEGQLQAVAAQLVEGWDRSETIQFEPFVFSRVSERGESIGLAVRLTGVYASHHLKAQAAAGAFVGSDIRVVESHGAHFLDLLDGHVGGLGTPAGVPAAPAHLSWNDFLLGRYKEWANGQKMNSFAAMTKAVREALGEDISCVQTMLEYKEPTGMLYAKQLGPQLFLSSGNVNDHFGLVKPGGVVWTLGMKAEVEEDGRTFAKEFVKFSCRSPQGPAVAIPPNPKDQSVQAPAAWRSATGRLESEFAECLREAFADAIFADISAASVDPRSPPPDAAPSAEQAPSRWVSWTRETGGTAFERFFQGERPHNPQARVIPVCVPMYNEEASELILTLLDIHKMAKRLGNAYQLKVCVIQDGFLKMSRSAKAALRAMFPPEKYKDWEGALQEGALNERNRGQKMTCVVQSSRPVSLKDLKGLKDLKVEAALDDEIEEMLRGELGELDITLVLKVDNRKKHNSHDLFFRGFANHLNAKLAFATDCGTLFAEDCLEILVREMERDPMCVAMTGRQRVMTKLQQPNCKKEGLQGWMLRCAQGFDYEASTVVFNGCFSLLGCLAVVPGPCGLFRLGPLLERAESGGGAAGGEGKSPFDFYAEAAQRAESGKEMLEGNCVLAEDRVLTFAAKYLTKGKHQVRWAPDALFYFQSETCLSQLVAQRRRWLNGTVAGYLFVWQELGAPKLPSDHHRLNIFVIRRLIELMLLIYVGIALAPGLYIYGLCLSLRYLKVVSMEEPRHDVHILWILAVSYFSVFAAFSVMHHRGRGYDPRLFAVVGSLNAAVTGIMCYVLALAVCRGSTWLQWVSLCTFALPVMLNVLVPDFTALLRMAQSFVVYLLFMPTMQGYFLTLAIARTFDLSWGNRAGVGGEVEALRMQSQAMMAAQMLMNLTLVILAMYLQDSSAYIVFGAVLSALLLLPTAFISLGSAWQLLGSPLFLLGALAAAALTACSHLEALPLSSSLAESPAAARWFVERPLCDQLALLTLLIVVLKVLWWTAAGVVGCLCRKKEAQRYKSEELFDPISPVGGLREDLTGPDAV